MRYIRFERGKVEKRGSEGFWRVRGVIFGLGRRGNARWRVSVLMNDKF